MSDLELIARVRRCAAENPHRIAYAEADGGRSLTYAQLVIHVDALAASQAFPDAARRVVLLRCANRIEFPIWFLSLLSSGADVMPVSVALTHVELRQAAQRAGADTIVADHESAVAMADVVPNAWPVELALQSTAAQIAPTTDALGSLLLASSGTTGVPKVVRRSAASLDAVARNMADAIQFATSDQVIAAVPLSHSYGLEHGLLAPLWAGSSVRLVNGFDLQAIARALADGATVLPAVPSMTEMLATLSDAGLAAPKLRAVYSAGGPLPVAVGERFAAHFGVRVGQVYGMTEIGSVTYNDGLAEPFEPASVGRPMRGVSVQIRDANDPQSPAPTGEEGEVLVHAPSMFDGYLAGETPLMDGHFPTGDLGRLDALGRLTITGRAKLLVDVGGMKVNPAEVEAVIASHPAVLECAVVPMRQTETVQRLRALVVVRDPLSPPTSDDIRRFARERLAGYKVPRLVEFLPALPRNAAGKVQRRLLEEG